MHKSKVELTSLFLGCLALTKAICVRTEQEDIFFNENICFGQIKLQGYMSGTGSDF